MDVIEKDGKKVFVGKEDPQNPPVFVKKFIMRYCQKCKAENTNDRTECVKCGTVIDDNKLQCPICKRYFDYLLGDVKQGCEGCYDHSKDQPRKDTNEQEPGEVFL